MSITNPISLGFIEYAKPFNVQRKAFPDYDCRARAVMAFDVWKQIMTLREKLHHLNQMTAHLRPTGQNDTFMQAMYEEWIPTNIMAPLFKLQIQFFPGYLKTRQEVEQRLVVIMPFRLSIDESEALLKPHRYFDTSDIPQSAYSELREILWGVSKMNCLVIIMNSTLGHDKDFGHVTKEMQETFLEMCEALFKLCVSCFGCFYPSHQYNLQTFLEETFEIWQQNDVEAARVYINKATLWAEIEHGQMKAFNERMAQESYGNAVIDGWYNWTINPEEPLQIDVPTPEPDLSLFLQSEEFFNEFVI